VPVDAFDLEKFREVVENELAADEVSVIITQGPCRLLKSFEQKPPKQVCADLCKSCKLCIKIGCPALSMTVKNGKQIAKIQELQCVGCGVCVGLCKFDAIRNFGEV
jgi:indolepyruvate ferredoxin oxidoreductase alpha subunit